MTTETSGLLLGYFPLWGASLDSDSVGLMGGPSRLRALRGRMAAGDEFDVWMGASEILRLAGWPRTACMPGCCRDPQGTRKILVTRSVV